MQVAEEQQCPLEVGRRWYSEFALKGCAGRLTVASGTDEAAEKRSESDVLRVQLVVGMLLRPAAVAAFWQTVEAAWSHLHPGPFPLSPFYPSSTGKKYTFI